MHSHVVTIVLVVAFVGPLIAFAVYEFWPQKPHCRHCLDVFELCMNRMSDSQCQFLKDMENKHGASGQEGER